MTTYIHFATSTRYCGQLNHLVCQGIYPFGNCCYVLYILKVFSVLELSSALFEFLEHIHAGSLKIEPVICL